MANLGNKFTVKFDNRTEVLRNVTEVHFNYDNGDDIYTQRVAFESDIHGTGITYAIGDVLEFSSELETCKADSF